MMAYRLDVHITLKNVSFRAVNYIKITRSVFVLGDTAIIKIPLSAYMRNAGSVALEKVQIIDKIKPGDPITIRIGYNDKLRTEFVGYVRRLNLNTPLEIECEDNIYLLRATNIKKSWQNTSIKSIVEFICRKAGVKVHPGLPDITVTSLIIDNQTALWTLQELASAYGLTMYFDLDGVLYANLAYLRDKGVVTLESGRNIIKSAELKWIFADDIRIQIKAISVEKNGKRLEAEIGDKDGEIRTLYFYDVQNLSELKKLAANEINKYKYTGYRGSVNCFLQPFLEPSATCQLKDNQFPDRSGRYFVESTEVTFSTNGARRKVGLGVKLN